MFKYSDKQQLVGSGGVLKASQLGPGWRPGLKSIFSIAAAQKMYLVATIMAIIICRNMSI